MGFNSGFKGLKMCTICYPCTSTEVRLKFSVSVFMLPDFSNFLVRIPETSPRCHIQADGNLYSHHGEKLKI